MWKRNTHSLPLVWRGLKWQPGHLPWPGIELVTFGCREWCTIPEQHLPGLPYIVFDHLTDIKSTSNSVILNHEFQQWAPHCLPNDAHAPGTFPPQALRFSSELLMCQPWENFMLSCLHMWVLQPLKYHPQSITCKRSTAI